MMQSSGGCLLQMGMLEESLVWSMLPQPATVSSSMGGAPPSRSPGPTGSATEQWSEIFPAQPNSAAGLEERGWAAHLRSAAWAARDTNTVAAALGGAVRQLLCTRRRHCSTTWTSPGVPTSSSQKSLPFECCSSAFVWCYLHGFSMANFWAAQCTLTLSSPAAIKAPVVQASADRLPRCADEWSWSFCTAPSRSPRGLRSGCNAGQSWLGTITSGSPTPRSAVVRALVLRNRLLQVQSNCNQQQTTALQIECTAKSPHKPHNPPVLFMGWQNVQSKVYLTKA